MAIVLTAEQREQLHSLLDETLNRLPASFFVSVSYMCWAYRRRGFVLNAAGKIVEWLY